MGDLMTMLEKAESVIDEEEAIDLSKKMKKGSYDLNDFLTNLKQIRKLGPLENLLKLLPGAKKWDLIMYKLILKI